MGWNTVSTHTCTPAYTYNQQQQQRQDIAFIYLGGQLEELHVHRLAHERVERRRRGEAVEAWVRPEDVHRHVEAAGGEQRLHHPVERLAVQDLALCGVAWCVGVA